MYLFIYVVINFFNGYFQYVKRQKLELGLNDILSKYFIREGIMQKYRMQEYRIKRVFIVMFCFFIFKSKVGIIDFFFKVIQNLDKCIYFLQLNEFCLFNFVDYLMIVLRMYFLYFFYNYFIL